MKLCTATHEQVQHKIGDVMLSTLERWFDEHAHEKKQFAAFFNGAASRIGGRVMDVTGSKHVMIVRVAFADCVRTLTLRVKGVNVVLSVERRDILT